MELDDLQCPICLEILSDPVMLPVCGHSLCRPCLVSLTPQPPLCPICRTQHRGLSVDQLPSNYIVANLIRQRNKGDSINMTASQGSSIYAVNISSVLAPMRPPPAPTEATGAPSAPPLSDILDTEEELVLSASSLSQESHLLNMTSETLVTDQVQISPENANVSTIQIPLIMSEEETSQIQSQREQSETIDNSQADLEISTANPRTTETTEANNITLYSPIINTNTLQSAASLDELCSNNRHLFSVLRDAPLPEPPQPQRSSTPILQFNQVPSVQIKIPEPRVFECKQIISGLILLLVALIFLTSYSWMIISSIFSTRLKIKIENIYILIDGACGLPKFIHLAYRLIKGKSSTVEKCLYGLYFTFDLVMLLIGIISFKELGINTVLLVNSPFALIATFSMIISALSVTHYTALPKLKAKSDFGKFLGCILLFIFTLSLFAGCAVIIGVGYYYFIGFEQIYLLTAGASGILIFLHGICFVINGRRSCFEEYLGCLYSVYSLIWCIVGLILVSKTAFWIVNGPMIAITLLIILFWSIRITALSLTTSVPFNRSTSC